MANLLTLVVACMMVCGCCAAAKEGYPAPKLNPPTQSMSSVVARINANNQQVPTLWCTLNYAATIRDNGQTHSVSSDDGVLLYRRPLDFRLVGKKEFVGNVFDMGSNQSEFWLEVLPGTNRLWWGRYADLARINPDRLPIPIRPDLVMEVLGVSVINSNFLAPPVPVMRYDNALDVYIFVFHVPGADRWLAQKEIWYDRKTLRPRRVILYDLNGRPVLIADLSMDKPVQTPDQPQAQWPLIPGEYKLFFPDSGSTMEITLKDVRLRKGMVPNARSFQVPDVQGTDVRVTQLGGGGGA